MSSAPDQHARPGRLEALALSLAAVTLAAAHDPWADRVVAYEPGTTPAPGYTDPQTAVGMPERFTGEGSFPAVVSIFNPPWGSDEIVSIGEGGFLTVQFDEPLTDDTGHPFGVDLLIFGNGGFIDADYPNGRIGSPPQTFGTDQMRVSISADGHRFVQLGLFTEGFLPAQGYLDSGPYDDTPGRLPSDFTLPVDPGLTLSDFDGLSYAQALGLYAGSGGGTPIDIAPGGLDAVRFVRIDVFDDGDPNTSLNAEVDAFAAVPEPATTLLLALLVALCARRRGAPRAGAVRRAASASGAPQSGPATTAARRAALLLLPGAGLCAGPLSAADWTHYAADAARTGIASAAPPRVDSVVWTAASGVEEEYVFGSSPVLAGGRAFVNARCFENGVHVGNLLIAYDARGGTRLWAAPLEPDAYDSWSSPAVDTRNQTVLLGCGAKLYALRVADGRIAWQTALERAVVNASPAVSRDLLCAGAPANRAFISDYNGFGPAARLYAVNVDPFDATGNPYQPGQIVWTAELPGASGNTPAYASGVVYVASVGGQLRAHDALDGQLLWLTDLAAQGYPPDTAFFGGLAVRRGQLYAASYGFYGGQNNSLLFKLEAASGRIVWDTPCERSAAVPVVTDDGLILLSGGIAGFGSTVKIQAFRDLGDQAQPLWDTYQDTDGTLTVGGWSHQPAYSRGRLYAGAPDPGDFFGPYRELLVLDVRRVPGDPDFIVWRHAGSGGSPAVAEGMLYSLGQDGLSAFGPAPLAGTAAPDPLRPQQLIPRRP